jgi:hypothetical protein
MPVQRGPDGPLDYAPSQARPAVGADTTPPPQELQDKPPRIVKSLRDDRDPGAPLGMASSRDALPSRGRTSLRDALSSRESLASRNGPPPRGTPSMRSPLFPREGVSLRNGLAAQDSLPSRDVPPLPPTDGLHSRATTSLRDTPLLRDAVLPPAPPPRGDLISRAGPHSLPDDAVDLDLAPPNETISRWEAGVSRGSATGSASAADAAWKPKKRSVEVFEGDVALKELRSRLAATPTDQTPEPPLAPPAKTPIFASAARLRGVVLAAGVLWATPANQQAGEEAALMSPLETPGSAVQNVAAERASDPSAAGQAAGAALYQDFLKWQQLRGR